MENVCEEMNELAKSLVGWIGGGVELSVGKGMYCKYKSWYWILRVEIKQIS